MEETSYKLNGKAIYSPKGAAREYAAVGCNLYTGCPHNCQYCYLKRGVLAPQLGGTEVKLKKCFKDAEDAVMTFCREVDKHIEYLQKVGVFFSFSTDPLIKETREVTKACVIQANIRKIPVKILTKNADFIDDDIFISWLLVHDFRKDLVAFGFTLTGRDDMEPNAASNMKRIITRQRLHTLGFKTFASIEPIIDFDCSFRMIEESAGFCDLYKIGLRSGVKSNYYEPSWCAYFIGKVTVLCEKMGFKVYWKDSVRKYIRTNMAKDKFEEVLSLSKNFVNTDYNLFTGSHQ